MGCVGCFEGRAFKVVSVQLGFKTCVVELMDVPVVSV